MLQLARSAGREMAAGRGNVIGAMDYGAVGCDAISRRGKRHVAAIGGGAIAFGSDAHDYV